MTATTPALLRRLRRRAMFSRTRAERAYWRRALNRRRSASPATAISGAGLKLIETFEGFRSHPYKDAVGKWTIGYGSTKDVGPGTRPVTRRQARERLRHEVDATYGKAVAKTAAAIGIELRQHEFDALASAVYNLGPGILDEGRSLGQALRAKNWRVAVPGALLMYDNAGGRKLAGLTRRRKAEARLFRTGKDTTP